MKVELVQPSLRREWQLRRGDDVIATLQIPLLRRGASADLAGRSLEIARVGGLRAEYVVLDGMTQEQLAHLRPDGRRRLLETADRTAEWKRLSRKEGYGFVGPDGEHFLRAKVSSGFAHTNGEVEVAARPRAISGAGCDLNLSAEDDGCALVELRARRVAGS